MTTHPRKTLPYTLANNQSARLFISGHVGDEHDWAWTSKLLLAPARVEQTRKALGLLMTDLNGQFTYHGDGLAEARTMLANMQIVQEELDEIQAEHDEWAERAKRYKAHIQRRIDQAEVERRRLNIALSRIDNEEADLWAMDMLAHVVEQIFMHQQFTDTDDGGYEPSEYDRILWKLLVDVKLPIEGSGVLLDLIKRKQKIDNYPGYKEAS